MECEPKNSLLAIHRDYPTIKFYDFAKGTAAQFSSAPPPEKSHVTKTENFFPFPSPTNGGFSEIGVNTDQMDLPPW